MDDILLSDSNVYILKRIFEEVKKYLFVGGCKLLLKNYKEDNLIV